MKPSLYYLLFISMLFNLPLFAKEDFKVVTESWEGYTNKDGSGAYFEILKRVFEPEYNFKYEIFPYARALYLVESNRDGVDAIIGIDEKSAKGLIVPKHYIETDKTYVVSLKNKYIYKGTSSLKNKIVAFVNDYGYEKYLPIDIKTHSILAENRESIGGLLKLGRVDYYIESTSTVAELLAKKILNLDEFSLVEEPILNVPLYVAFSKGSQDPVSKKFKGEKLKEIFDKKYSSLINSGEILKIFEKYKLELPKYN